MVAAAGARWIVAELLRPEPPEPVATGSWRLAGQAGGLKVATAAPAWATPATSWAAGAASRALRC